MTTDTLKPIDGPVDMHVHVVGNGAGGTGCWLRVTGWHRPLAVFMLRHIGLPGDLMRGDLDQLYVDYLLRSVRGSSLSQVVLLAQDEVRNRDGSIMDGVGSFYVPNEYVLRLAAEHAEFLPAVSIHPARPDAMEELERCLEGGAVMMKCLPNCQNIDCGDRRFTRFWERMAAAGLPLLAHTGGEHTLPVVRPEFADPRRLEWPLQCGVKVIAAHSATRSGISDPDYYEEFEKMLDRYPHLYGDSSAFNLPFRSRAIRRVLESRFAERILHGSDLPVPILGWWAFARGLLSWSDLRRCHRSSNLLERDYQLKRALGFPESCFTAVRGILRKAPESSADEGKIKPGSSIRG